MNPNISKTPAERIQAAYRSAGVVLTVAECQSRLDAVKWGNGEVDDEPTLVRWMISGIQEARKKGIEFARAAYRPMEAYRRK